jgi:prepilin-type N-terminal cleavage/methylation domain-containing protein
MSDLRPLACRLAGPPPQRRDLWARGPLSGGPDNHGFTLLELVVVLAIITIAALIGAGSMQSHLPRYRMVQTAKKLRSDLRRVQELATRTGRQARLRLVAPAGDCGSTDTWGGGWVLEVGDDSRLSRRWDVLPEDALADGSDDDQSQGIIDLGPDGTDRARDVCLDDWGTITGPGGASADSIVFDSRGFLQNPTTDLASGYIRIPVVNQAAAREGVNDRIHVLVAATGFIRLHSALGDEYDGAAVGAQTTSSRQ